MIELFPTTEETKSLSVGIHTPGQEMTRAEFETALRDPRLGAKAFLLYDGNGPFYYIGGPWRDPFIIRAPFGPDMDHSPVWVTFLQLYQMFLIAGEGKFGLA